MESLTPQQAFASVLEAKERRRHELARLPFLEKVRIVVELQRMVAPILRARGKQAVVWRLDDAEGVPKTDEKMGQALRPVPPL